MDISDVPSASGIYERGKSQPDGPRCQHRQSLLEDRGVLREIDNELAGGLLPAAENAKGATYLSTVGTTVLEKNFVVRNKVSNQKKLKWKLKPIDHEAVGCVAALHDHAQSKS